MNNFARLVKPARLPNYLRGARKAIGFTQKELAFLLGVKTGSNITRYERFARKPTLPTALTLEAILDVPVRELFAGLYQEAESGMAAKAQRLLQHLEGSSNSRVSSVKLAFLERLAGKARAQSHSRNL